HRRPGRLRLGERALTRSIRSGPRLGSAGPPRPVRCPRGRPGPRGVADGHFDAPAPAQCGTSRPAAPPSAPPPPPPPPPPPARPPAGRPPNATPPPPATRQTRHLPPRRTAKCATSPPAPGHRTGKPPTSHLTPPPGTTKAAGITPGGLTSAESQNQRLMMS